MISKESYNDKDDNIFKTSSYSKVGVFNLPYNAKLKDRARKLRKAGNLAEVLFWNEVKQNKIGFDFTRQQIIGNYIVDFYCSKLKLVIEIDGSSHNEKQEYDAIRDQFFKSYNLNVLHFTDVDVKKNIIGIIEAVKFWIESTIHLH